MTEINLSKTPAVRCRRCGRSTAKEDPFDVVIPYKAASYSELSGFDDEGRMILGMGDEGRPSWFGLAQIVCRCGHQWVTQRGWA